jgi:diguanylate cyclase (GGDEF)-like protein
LRRIAQALRSAVWQSGDLVAHYGGEETVLLPPATDTDGALEVAQRARLAVADLQIPHAASALGTVSVSLGVASGVRQHAVRTFERRGRSALSCQASGPEYRRRARLTIFAATIGAAHSRILF